MDAENPFGPFYPPRLQGAINHAERLHDAIARRAGGEGSPWLVGRRSEIACVVAYLVREWRSSAIDEDQAARAVLEYLDVLHEGFVAHVGMAPPPCCGLDSVTATSPSTLVSVAGRAHIDPEAFAATTTIDVDPAELLVGLDTPEARR